MMRAITIRCAGRTIHAYHYGTLAEAHAYAMERVEEFRDAETRYMDKPFSVKIEPIKNSCDF